MVTQSNQQSENCFARKSISRILRIFSSNSKSFVKTNRETFCVKFGFWNTKYIVFPIFIIFKLSINPYKYILANWYPACNLCPTTFLDNWLLKSKTDVWVSHTDDKSYNITWCIHTFLERCNVVANIFICDFSTIHVKTWENKKHLLSAFHISRNTNYLVPYG